jgi:hypothetical protein
MGHDIPRAGAQIDLAGRAPMGAGQLQRVYAFPGRDDLLIKVVRPNFVQESWTGWRGWLKRRRRMGMFTNALRTIGEQLALRNIGPLPRRHLQELVGFVETSEGPGVIVRAVRGRDGGYAPTLQHLIESGRFTDQTRASLDQFAEWLKASPVIVGDLHVGNLVLAWDEEFQERFVLIDGMGEKILIPLNAWFPALNRANTGDRLRRLYRQVDRRLTQRAAEAAPPQT